MSRLKEDLFRKLVRELIKQELDEANSTATAGGEYQTPHAFKGSNKKGKKKKKAGYNGGHSDPTIGTDNFEPKDPKLRKESVNEQQKKDSQNLIIEFGKSFQKFTRAVHMLGKSMTNITGDKTDQKIIQKAFRKHVIPFGWVVDSWNKGQQKNPHIDEAAFSSREAQQILNQDITKMSKILGKASQQVIKIMMDGVKGGKYDAMDIPRGIEVGPLNRTHEGERPFMKMLWRKVRDGFRRYSKNNKLRK